MYALAVAVWTLGEIINSPTQMGLVVRLSPTHGRGRYQGMYALSWSIASLTAPLLGGTVIDRYGANALWVGCAVVGTVAAAGYGLLLRSLPGRAAAVAASSQGADAESSQGADAESSQGADAGTPSPCAAPSTPSSSSPSSSPAASV